MSQPTSPPAPMGPWRVVKVGGSLLDYEGLVPDLRRWLTSQPPAANLLIAGGGRVADIVRDFDRLHQLRPEAAHWLAVRAMALNADLLAGLLPEAKSAPRLGPLRRRSDAAGLWILDPWQFLKEEDARPDAPLPQTWSVTSDSIAARAAEVLAAIELVLLKSCLPEGGCTRQAAARNGYVDAYFPAAAAKLENVRCFNLRDPAFQSVRLTP